MRLQPSKFERLCACDVLLLVFVFNCCCWLLRAVIDVRRWDELVGLPHARARLKLYGT